MAISKIHNTITDHNAFEIDRIWTRVLVELVNKHSQIWNVFAGIGLTSDPEWVSQILGIFFEEVKQSIEVVIGCSYIVIYKIGIIIIRKTYTCWGFKKQ
jgi:hypothetical protein